MSKLTKRLLVIFFILLLSSLIIYYDAFYLAPNRLIVRYENISDNKISYKIDGLSICFFSDLHYGAFADEERLNNLVNKINSQNCDIVIFLGDLFDQSAKLDENSVNIVINCLNKIDAKYGKFAIYGNHDLVSNIFKTNYESVLEQSNFELLCNENLHLSLKSKKYINLVALDSEANGSLDLDSAFNEIENDYYTIVICHTPDTIDKLKDYSFDLMVSGHTHGGQINIPLYGPIYKNNYGEKYSKGKFYFDNKTLYVTTGVGTTRFNVRFLADPEIVVYHFNSN